MKEIYPKVCEMSRQKPQKFRYVKSNGLCDKVFQDSSFVHNMTQMVA